MNSRFATLALSRSIYVLDGFQASAKENNHNTPCLSNWFTDSRRRACNSRTSVSLFSIIWTNFSPVLRLLWNRFSPSRRSLLINFTVSGSFSGKRTKSQGSSSCCNWVIRAFNLLCFFSCFCWFFLRWDLIPPQCVSHD